MGREIRMVPPNWEHTKEDCGRGLEEGPLVHRPLHQTAGEGRGEISRMTIKQIQDAHREWLNRNFGDKTGDGVAQLEQFLGITEELGELAHALLKGRQGIRGSAEKHEAAAKDAVGDIFIFLSGFCCRKGWDLQEIIEETWAEVSQRDWTKKEAV